MDVEVAKLELNTPFDLFFLVEWFVNILSFLWSNLFDGFERRNILNERKFRYTLYSSLWMLKWWNIQVFEC